MARSGSYCGTTWHNVAGAFVIRSVGQKSDRGHPILGPKEPSLLLVLPSTGSLSTMADTDDIFCLFPSSDSAGSVGALLAINYSANQSRFVAPRRVPHLLSSQLSQDQVFADDVDRHARAATEQPEQHNSVEYKPCLRATFSDGPKTRHGLIAGWDPKADIRLPKYTGVSFHHFSLTFNEEYQPVVRDLGSSIGTSITYGKQDTEPRVSFDWIVGGHNFLELRNKSPIQINITQFLKFHLVVPEHDITSPSYRAKVDKFREGTADPDKLLGEIKLISRPETVVATGTQTPRKGAIILKDEVGKGAFAVVYRAWNVATGEQWASKQPSKEGKKRLGKERWQEEAAIMQRISHDHIVKFLGVESKPTALRFEFAPGGALEDHILRRDYFNGFECKQITCQLLAALKYLHEDLEPMVVHRDIKAENILVFHRQDGDVLVKFADFGLAKEGEYLRTFCGTLRNLPPELSNIPRAGYTPAVDLWSLGVVIAQLLCGLPTWKKEYEDNLLLWGEVIVRKLERWLRQTGDSLAQFLLETMVIIDADARWRAVDCYPRAISLPDGPRATWKVQIPVSTILPMVGKDASGDDEDDSHDSTGQSEQTTIRLGAEDNDEEVKTVIMRNSSGITVDEVINGFPSLDSDSSDESLTGISEPRRFERSGAPDPDSLAHPLPVLEFLNQFANPHDTLFGKTSFGQCSTAGISSSNTTPRILDSETHDNELSIGNQMAIPRVDVVLSGKGRALYTTRGCGRLATDEVNLEPPESDGGNTQNKRKRPRSINDGSVASPENCSRTTKGGTRSKAQR